MQQEQELFSHVGDNFISLSHLTRLSVFSSTLSGPEFTQDKNVYVCMNERDILKIIQEHHLLVRGFSP